MGLAPADNTCLASSCGDATKIRLPAAASWLYLSLRLDYNRRSAFAHRSANACGQVLPAGLLVLPGRLNHAVVIDRPQEKREAAIPHGMTDETTQPSLLSRVRDGSNNAAWREFDTKYRDLILRYCRAKGLQAADAEDARQIAMIILAKSLRNFEYQPSKGRFRGYLGMVVRSAISRQFAKPDAHARALDTAILESAKADDDGHIDELWEQEWVSHHYRLAMRTMRQTHESKSVQMFDRLLEGRSVDEVAAEFETTSQAVHKVKQRFRNRLKELIAAQVQQEDDPDA